MSGELLERRPERVASRAIKRSSVEVGGNRIFFSVVPVDSDIPKRGDVAMAYPYPDDRDITGPELVVRECLEGNGSVMLERVEGYVRDNPDLFSIDPSKL